MKRKLFLSTCSLLFGGMLFAQGHFNCGLPEKLAKLYAEDPQLEKDHEKLLLSGLTKSGDDSTVFIVPIVFHIIHSYGADNITDDQILDQVNILNRDYRLKNSDTSFVVPSFKKLYKDVRIEFRLAKKDPFGRCTNGIEHIYSHEVSQGDDYSKLRQWNRANYLNVWVVPKIGSVGVAGYAFYPTDVDGAGFFRDGIIILNGYIGSTGTSSPNNSRALTHEIGHYLGLAHPWGNTNNPGVSCGDDNVADTPITKGSTTCVLDLSVCNTPIIENVQNYMDYSYCSRMFTVGQVAAMRAIIQGVAGQRNNLITPQTHALTGIDLTNPPTCVPIADFNSSIRYVCQGANVTFKDFSYNAPVVSRQWIFEGGTPATSTAAQPIVTYNSPGGKKVTLIVTNTAGSDTLTMDKYIEVANNYADYYGPKSLNMEDSHNDWFRVFNPENNYSVFSVVSNSGYDFSTAYRLKLYRNIAGSLPNTELGNYYNTLGGTVDALITPSFNLTKTTGTTVSFKYAFATNGQQESALTEKLIVYASRDCGATWTARKTITGTELLTGGYVGYIDYKPLNNSQWKTATFSYLSSPLDVNTRFKFEFTASDFSNNLYIDDIFVNGTLGLTDLGQAIELNVFPNPTTAGEAIHINYVAQDDAVEFILRDLQGKEIKRVVRNEKNQAVSFTLTENEKLSSSCYFLEVKAGEASTTKKIVIIK